MSSVIVQIYGNSTTVIENVQPTQFYTRLTFSMLATGYRVRTICVPNISLNTISVLNICVDTSSATYCQHIHAIMKLNALINNCW